MYMLGYIAVIQLRKGNHEKGYKGHKLMLVHVAFP